MTATPIPTAPTSAVTVIEQDSSSGVVEWNLDGFPADQYNRLLPVATLQIPTDLLRPVVQVVKLNPDPNGGDVYTSRDTPDGHAAPTKVGLRKFATAAGISFIDERRVDDGRDPDVIEVTTVAEMLLPTGQRIRATGTKRVDLNAQTWASPAQRAKFKSFFQEHVASRAQNRAIRALLSLRGSYPIAVYSKPFAVVSFAPNMAHPEVRARILDAMAPVAAQLYGGPPETKALAAGPTINVTPAPEEDPAPSGPQEPDWMKGSIPATEAPKPKPAEKPDVLVATRAFAVEGDDAEELASPEDLAKLREIFAGWDGRIVGAGIRAVWPDQEPNALSKGQARAIGRVQESLGHDDFERAWRRIAEQQTAGAAA